jgi:hypothetical protein
MNPSWGGHLDLVQSLIVLLWGLIVTLILIIAWGAKAWIQSQTDINQANLEEHKTLHGRVTAVEKDLSKLIGAFGAKY